VASHRSRLGKSAALFTGIARARAPVIVTIDGDRQYDPRDIHRLLDAYRAESVPPVGLAAGRHRRRQDGRWRWAVSILANVVRRRVLGDGVSDAACGLKVFGRDAFLGLPQFEGVHRFLPALLRQEGRVVSIDVDHRPRLVGRSKYGARNRLWVGLTGLVRVHRLIRRRHKDDPIDSTARRRTEAGRGCDQS
jgi:dolichol-phosphate mannosyltransferase